ncbi:MAG: hypothetical protein IMY72_14280 [Bacteroidetes bacterium]|nr:hypothetical protein [Bacteroidota bacterium]
MKKYETRLIAFIDILGFSDLIKNPKITTGISETSNPLENLVSALQILHSEARLEPELQDAETKLDYENSPEKDRQVSIFSDSVIISYKVSLLNECLEELLDKLITTQLRLFEHGVLLRGGITIGELIHKNEFCFGPGMIKAYEIENKKAIYPRILIDQAIFNHDNFKNTNLLKMLIAKSSDNFKYLNTFNFFKEYHLRYESLLSNLPILKIINISVTIEKNLDTKDKKVREKYLWLAKEFNGFLDGIKKKFEIPDNHIDCPNNYKIKYN